MNKYFFLLFSLLVFSQENTQVYEVLSYDDFKNQINNDNVLLFDIRTMDEFNSGHLKHTSLLYNILWLTICQAHI